jgi:transcriptional regulator with XRE-family HTH domain
MPNRRFTQEDLADLARLSRLANSGQARAIRERAGVEASDLARSIGVDTSSLWRWESGARGRHTPRNAEVALRWLQALDALQAALEQDGEEEATPALAAASR